MKIAIFVEKFPTLSETFVLAQIIAFIRGGHDVTIFPLKAGGDNEAHREVVEYSLDSKSHAAPLISGSYIIRALDVLRHMFRLRHNAWRVIPLLDPLAHGHHAVSLRSVIGAIPLVDRGEEYDIAYAHFEPPANRMMLLLEAGILKAKHCVAAVHTSYILDNQVPYRLVQAEKKYFLTKTTKRVSLILPVSQYLSDLLIKYGVDPNRLLVHRMGVDTSLFQRVQRTAETRYSLLSVCRLVEKKGLRYAIEACRILRKRGIPVKYRIVGDGPLRCELEEQSREAGLSEYVEFVGAVTQEAVHKYYREAGVFLCPSVVDKYGDREGICVSLMEAMATGLPAIATSNGALSELVYNERSGLLVEECNSETLATAVQRIIENSDYSRMLADKGAQIVESQYNLALLNAKLLETFEALTNSTRRQ